jgi:hypothetical protein
MEFLDDRMDYGGCVIQAAPLPLANSRWDLRIFIQRHDGEGVTETKYFDTPTFATKEEAFSACFQFGCDIIDGKVEPRYVPV